MTSRTRRALDGRRHSPRLRAGKFAGPLARRNGQARAGRIRSRIPNALHGARPCSYRSDRDWLVLAKQPPAQRSYAATHQRSLRDTAGSRRFPGGSARHIAERRDPVQLPSSYASARETFRVQHRAQGRNDRAAAAGELGFLLAIELSTRRALAARGRNGCKPSRGMTTRIRIRTIPIPWLPSLGRPDLRRNDGWIL